MKNFEKIVIGIIILSLLLKFFLISGGVILCIFSFSVLSGFYFYLGFAFFNNLKLKGLFNSSSYQGISNKRIIGGIVTGLALSLLCIGFMFKLMHWPGQKIYLLYGLLSAILILMIVIIRKKGHFDSYYKMIITRLVITGIFGILFLIITDSMILKIQYRKHPGYIEAFNQFQKSPNDEDAIKRFEKEKDRIFMSDEEFEYFHSEKK